MAEKTVYEHLREKGVSRRDFMKLCGVLAGVMGLSSSAAVKALGAAAGRGPGRNWWPRRWRPSRACR